MWYGRRNFQLNSQTVLRDLYRLLTLVAADGPVMRMSSETNDPLRYLRNRVIEDEFVRLLVATAIANRIQLEHMSGLRDDPDELSFDSVDRTCGRLQPNADLQTAVPLLFREACNKIVHALNIVVETRGPPEEVPVERTVTLRGQLQRNIWLAHMDLYDYVRASIINFREF
jgi:hypothetical protein